MASSSILLLPLERLSPSGSLTAQKCVQGKSSLPRYNRQHGQRGIRTYQIRDSPFSLFSKTLVGIYVGAKNGGMSQRLSIMCHSRGKGGAEHERAKLKNVTQQMRLLLESEGLLATEAAYSLVNCMSPEGRTALISALFPGKQCANLIFMGFYQIV